MKKKSPSALWPVKTILSRIYFIRGQKIMIDKDLAELYGVKPIRLREQIKRNKTRFPASFMFQLNRSEALAMVSQNAIPSLRSLGGALPYAFTEHGVIMAAPVLKSEQAVKVSLRLVEIFVRMREMLSDQKDILLKLEQLEKKVAGNEGDIRMIFSALKKLLQPVNPKRRRVGFRRNNEDD
jgi:hypothetical protein